MFIDIHVHTSLWQGCPDAGGETYATPEELFAGYDEIGVERCCVLPEHSPEYARSIQSNGEVLALAAKYPDRIIPFCNFDARMGTNSWNSPLDKMMLYYKEQGCKGIGEVVTNLEFLDPKMQNLFRCAEIADLPVTFHMSPHVGFEYGIVDNPGLPQLEETLRRFPKLKLFAHSQTFWAEMGKLKTIDDRFGYPEGKIEEEGAVPRLMRKYPNLYGDLSAGSGCNALTRDREYAVKFLNEFQDRLFFGTDICQPSMPTLRPLAQFLNSLLANGEISQSVFNKVARENAIRVLGL